MASAGVTIAAPAAAAVLAVAVCATEEPLTERIPRKTKYSSVVLKRDLPGQIRRSVNFLEEDIKSDIGRQPSRFITASPVTRFVSFEF